MSAKTRTHQSIEPHATSETQAGVLEIQVADSTHHQKIRMRAYEIYIQRGEQHGRDLDDWLQAERELNNESAQHTDEQRVIGRSLVPPS